MVAPGHPTREALHRSELAREARHRVEPSELAPDVLGRTRWHTKAPELLTARRWRDGGIAMARALDACSRSWGCGPRQRGQLRSAVRATHGACHGTPRHPVTMTLADQRPATLSVPRWKRSLDRILKLRCRRHDLRRVDRIPRQPTALPVPPCADLPRGDRPSVAGAS